LNSSAPQWSDESIDIGMLLTRLWRGRVWIGACIALFGGAFAAVAFIMTPVYRATTVLIPAGTESTGSGGLGSALGSLGGLASLAGVSLGGRGSTTEEALAVLGSRQFTDGFIARMNLMPELFADRWDPVRKGWKPDRQPPTSARAFAYFDKVVRSFNEDKKTGLVTVRIDWRDRVKAAEWANALVQSLNAEMRARAITQADASVAYLQRELAETTVLDTRTSISRLVGNAVNQRMLANVTEQYAFRVIDKAVPADVDDVVKPKKLIMIGTGILLGLIVGVILVLALREQRQAGAKPSEGHNSGN
jgi:uncharacterized protein involved in exopolysaccharide biosynthesis